MIRLAVTLLASSWVASTAISDIYFPEFHVRPPQNWINDPNGPFRDPKTGIIHLWMQYNPDGADWGNMSWYHTVSHDYVHFERLGATEALTFNPRKYNYSSGGFFSGSVTLVNGTVPIILYTCVSDMGQLQCMARPKNLSDPLLSEWQEEPSNPVIAKSPEHCVSSTVFRDPTTALWDSKRQLHIAFFGASLLRQDITYQPQTASVLAYTADASFQNWQFDSILLQDLYAPAGMFECPDFFEVPDADSAGIWVLKVSLMGITADQYWLGRYDRDARSFIRNGSPAWLDYGFYYASKSFYDPILKIQIIFGWIGEHGPAKGWSGAQSLPRAVEYDGDHRRLRVYPLPALKGLRSGMVYASSGRQLLNPKEPLPLVDPTGRGFPTMPSGSKLQQEIVANFTFPADLFDREPSAFVGLRIRQASSTQYATVGLTANPLGARMLAGTEIRAASYMELPMDPHASEAANAQNCSEMCAQDMRCVAWTYNWTHEERQAVQQKAYSSSVPHCSLKPFATLAQRALSSSCTSGYVKGALFVAQSSASGTQGDTSTHLGRAFILPHPEVPGQAQMSLHIFNDHSVMESFKDGGLERITSRLYIPTAASAGISATVSGTTRQVYLQSAEVYALGSIWSRRSEQMIFQ